MRHLIDFQRNTFQKMFFYTNKNQSRQIRHQSLKVNYEHTFKSSF